MNTNTLPAGITSLEPIPYGERRWNGSVWAPIQVDRYNAELARIAERHTAGMDTQHLINGLYNLANGFDQAVKEHRATITATDFNYQAVCECGWKSAATLMRHRAQGAAETHNAAWSGENNA